MSQASKSKPIARSPGLGIRSPNIVASIGTRQKIKADGSDKIKTDAEKAKTDHLNKGRSKDSGPINGTAGGNIDWIQCDICDRWELFDNADLGTSSTAEIKDAKFTCRMCKIESQMVTKDELTKKLVGIENKVCSIEERITALEAKLSAKLRESSDIREEINSIGAKQQEALSDIRTIKQKLDETKVAVESRGASNEEVGDKSQAESILYSDIAAKAVECKLKEYTEGLSQVKETLEKTKEESDELANHEQRSCNIVIYRAEETCDVRKEQLQADRIFCEELFGSVLDTGIDIASVKGIIRLGKKENAKCRPMLVKFASKSDRNKVMETLGKLREAPICFKKISVGYDMTPKEREEYKKLVSEVKAKGNESGEWVWRIKGQPGHYKIIKTQKQKISVTKF